MPTITSLFQNHGLIGALKRSPILRGFIRYLLPFYRSKNPAYSVPVWLSSDTRVMQKTLRAENISEVEAGYEEFASALSKLNTSSGIGRHLNERHGIERIEPYFDPKLINYTLRLPLDMVYRNGQMKYFAREAMRDLLPESIRTQSRVGVLNQFANDGFIKNRESLRQRLFDDPEPWRAYIDEKWLAQKLKKNAKVEDKELLVIWMSLTFSQWQRAIKPGGDLYEGCLVKG